MKVKSCDFEFGFDFNLDFNLGFIILGLDSAPLFQDSSSPIRLGLIILKEADSIRPQALPYKL